MPLTTASYTSSMNANPLQGRQASLPMFVYQLIRQPNENQISACDSFSAA